MTKAKLKARSKVKVRKPNKSGIVEKVLQDMHIAKL
jgi:hypothetical protein